MGLDYWADKHTPHLNQMVRWAWCGGKNREYLREMYLWSQGHTFWRKRVLGLDIFVKALWNNQTEKGLAAEYDRVVAAKERARESKTMPSILVIRTISEGEVSRKIGRKPITKAERRELLDLLDHPRINREYVMGFLAPEYRPKCHGEDSYCDCVMTAN